MRYEIIWSPAAQDGALRLRKSDPGSYKKLVRLVEELKAHPTTGTGRPKPLVGNRSGQWSRRITDKHRLVYEIRDNTVCVYVLSTYGHYDDR